MLVTGAVDVKFMRLVTIPRTASILDFNSLRWSISHSACAKELRSSCHLRGIAVQLMKYMSVRCCRALMSCRILPSVDELTDAAR